MAQLSIVKKSELEGAMRLDAEYYQPEYFDLVNKLNQSGLPLRRLGDLIREKVHRGILPEYTEVPGIPVVKTDNVRNDFMALDNCSYTTQGFFNKNSRGVLKPLDLVMTSTGQGTLGRVNVFNENFSAFADGHIAIIRTNKIDPYYLYAFLTSKYGQFQAERSYTGSTGQIEIYPDHIESFFVIVPDIRHQKSISELACEAYNLKRQSESLYLKAEQLLLDEIGFKDMGLSHQLHYTVPYKKAREVNRLDAEHYQPKYERLLQHIQQFPHLPLADVTQMIRNGKTPAAEDYSMEGVPILKVGGLRNTGVIEQCDEYVPASWAQSNTKGAVKQFDALVLCAAHLPTYIGKTGLLMEDLGPLTRAVGELIILRFNKKVYPEFVCVYLNLDPVRLVVQRLTRGNTAHLYPDDFSTLPVPILPPEIQQRIADMITQSWEARQKAKQLLEEAKQKVENLIESKSN